MPNTAKHTRTYMHKGASMTRVCSLLCDVLLWLYSVVFSALPGLTGTRQKLGIIQSLPFDDKPRARKIALPTPVGNSIVKKNNKKFFFKSK